MLQSERSLDNLSRLSNARSGVDIALVQSGVLESGDAVDLVSLGSMFYEPLTIFYRSPKALQQSAGQFPNPMTHTFPISVEAARYHKSGSRSFLYRYLPFWLASLANRGLVVLLPIIVVVIPGLRFLPQMYRWRIDNRVHRRYGELMALERETLGELTEQRRAALLDRLNQIERSAIARHMPGSHAEQVYVLREHIQFVRENLSRSEINPSPAHSE